MFHSNVTSRPVLSTMDTGGPQNPQLELQMRPAAPLSTSKRRSSFFSKTFRSLSSSSSHHEAVDDMSSGSTTPPRRFLHKTPTNGSSFIFHRIHRRASNNSTASSQMSDASTSKLASMKVLKHGPLKTDAKLWKSRSEYLVLTDRCLVRFHNVEAAKAIFADIAGPSHRLSRASTSSSLGQDVGPGEPRMEIPLPRVINMFNEEGSSPHFGLDIWWAESPPIISWANVKMFFGTPQERDEWMTEIRRAIRERACKPSTPEGIVESNVETRIRQFVTAEEPSCQCVPLDIFPVVQRTFPPRNKPDSAEAARKARDASSYYLLLGHNKCYLIRVCKTSVYKAPKDLEINVVDFGLATLVRLNATMVPHEERFVLGFRMPSEPEKRLELASRWYREIVMTFMKADRSVKPSWPQHLQNDIFDIRGLTAQLHLPCGQDFGGLERTLVAYCVAYNCQPPEWSVSWKCERREHNPEFRLLPSTAPGGYTPFQLLAVFKALRYNDYFKSLSFRDVDFSSLCGWYDLPQYNDSIADVSRNGLVIDIVHADILKASSVLFQELHAITFTSGSIKKIDLTNVLNSKRRLSSSAGSQSLPSFPQADIEIARPILLLLRTQNIPLDTLLLGGNPLTPAEVNELVSVLYIPDTFKHLDISRCNVDERRLEEIWDALPNQGNKMQVLNTSCNFGNVDHVVVRNSLAHFARLRRLSIAGNCLSQFTDFMFWDETIMQWQLEELDLSDTNLSEETTNILATYLAMPESNNLRRLDLNNCGLTGTTVAVLFRSIGQGRELVCSISGNYLEKGGDDLTSAIGYNFGPKALFLDMVEYRQEENYVKLIRALAVNSTINLLSLVGTSTPNQVSEDACMAVSDFFATNRAVQYLDFSGFSAKLDEGQLGLVFSRSLAGLTRNSTLRHLRIRNQKLNVNIGDLASAIAHNNTLRTLDVQDNGFNISNLTHMARSLEQNEGSIREFRPFSEAELSCTIRSTMQKFATPPPSQPEFRHRRSLKISGVTSSSRAAAADAKAEDASSKALMRELKGEWTVKMDHIERILERHRNAAAEAVGDAPYTTPGFASERFAEELPVLFGGLALVKSDSKRGTKHNDENANGASVVNGKALPHGLTIAAPHHVSRDEVLESPTSDSPSRSSSTASSSPLLQTPPEWAGSPVSSGENVKGHIPTIGLDPLVESTALV